MNIIFDLGGVVLDWQPRRLAERAFPEPEWQERIMQQVFGHPDWWDYDRGRFGPEEALERFTSHTGADRERVRSLLDSVAPSLLPIPETVSLMEELHHQGYPLYCLSNMNIPAAEYIRRTWDFWPLFRGIVISCDIKMAKPDADIFQYLLRQYNLVPEACVFIDDTAHNLETAASLGIGTVLFTGAADCRRQLAGRQLPGLPV